MERLWMTLDQIKAEYASNDYNPELLLQHLLHHVEASPASVPEGLTLNAIHAAWHGAGVDIAGGNWKRFVVMLSAAPTPPSTEDRKDAEHFRDGWTHSCNALCMEIALWIERCPHCGMPAPKAPAMQEDKP